MGLFSFLRRKKPEPFVPTTQTLLDLPRSEKVFKIAQNKELTDTAVFSELLTYFQHFPYQEVKVLQSCNEYIKAPKKNIYEFSSFMATMVNHVNNDSTQIVNFIRRLGLDKKKSYIFFTEKPSSDFGTMDQKSINQLVEWMETVLDYYEDHKTSSEINRDDICLAIHYNLAVFYDFFYFLLCHLADVRCDNLDSVAKHINIEF